MDMTVEQFESLAKTHFPDAIIRITAPELARRGTIHIECRVTTIAGLRGDTITDDLAMEVLHSHMEFLKWYFASCKDVC